MNDTDHRDTDPAPPDPDQAEPDVTELSPLELAELQAELRRALAELVVVIPHVFANLETGPLAWHQLIGALRALGATDDELDRVVRQTDRALADALDLENP